MTQAHGSKLRVLSSNGVHGALAQLGPQFERESGHTLDVSFDTANALATRIAAGERGDVAIQGQSSTVYHLRFLECNVF